MLLKILSMIAKPVQIPINIIRGLLASPLLKAMFVFAAFIIGLMIGFGTGSRYFETGNATKLGLSLKGASVKISGPCRVDGEVRRPALAEDDVKIVSINQEKLIGVVRATRETVECDMATTAIDYIPLLKDFSTTPTAIPTIMPFEANHEDRELSALFHRTIRASGVCQDTEGKSLPAIVEQSIDVIHAQRDGEDKSVIKISGLIKKTGTSVNCNSRDIKYAIIDNQPEQVVNGVIVSTVKKDLSGEILLVTSTCFPDKRLPPSKKLHNLFYPLINARVQVIQYSLDESGNIAYLAGALLDTGSLVECDATKYPISYKRFDSNTKLETIQDKSTNAEITDEVVKKPAQ